MVARTHPDPAAGKQCERILIPNPIKIISLITSKPKKKPQARRVMALLPEAESSAALKYYHVRDAKMSLASSLIKHLAVAHLSPSTPWHQTAITRDARTKPTWVDPSTGESPVAFNVTHQAGVVALIATPSLVSSSSSPPNPNPNHPNPNPDPDADHPNPTLTTTEENGESEESEQEKTVQVEVGIDIVSPAERRKRDHELIAAESWPRFVDMHADVFSPSETRYLKYEVLSQVPGLVSLSSSFSGERGGGLSTTDAKLRAFYALWALREAYVKLTGEALLAPWLSELEFRRFRPSAPTAGWDVVAAATPTTAEDTDNRYGPQVVTNHQIYFRGQRVQDVNISLRSMGPDFMICTAVRTPAKKEVGMSWKLGPFTVLDLDDVLEFAEARAVGEGESFGSW